MAVKPPMAVLVLYWAADVKTTRTPRVEETINPFRTAYTSTPFVCRHIPPLRLCVGIYLHSVCVSEYTSTPCVCVSAYTSTPCVCVCVGIYLPSVCVSVYTSTPFVSEVGCGADSSFSILAQSNRVWYPFTECCTRFSMSVFRLSSCCVECVQYFPPFCLFDCLHLEV